MKNRCCTDYYRNLLHAYELGLLSDEEREEFERHYLECGDCFREVREFEQAGKFLREDEDVYDTVRILADRDRASSGNGNFRGNVWRRAIFSRVVAAAAMIIVLAIPAYFMLRGPTERQVVELMAMRGESHGTIDLEKGGEVEIMFLLPDVLSDRSCSVKLVSFGGEEVFSGEDFSEFDRNGVGKLHLRVADFTDGYYKLLIADAAGEIHAEYLLKAE